MDTNYAFDNSQTNRIDEQSLAIAREIIAGTRDEHEGRWAIATLVMGANIGTAVMRRHSSWNEQAREDAAEKLNALITEKIVQTEPRFFRLEKLVDEGTSVCGFARSLARTAAASALRDATVVSRQVAFVDPTVESMDDSASRVAGYGDALSYGNTASALVADRISDDVEHDLNAVRIAEDFTEAAHGAVAINRLKLADKALREAFALPAAIRPDDLIDREAVLAMLNDDENAARDAAAALHALIDGVQTAEQADIDERLLALWDDYTADQLLALITKPARVAHTLATAAMTLDPKPAREAIRSALATIRRLTPESKQWQGITRDLLDSYLAAETEANSAYNRSSTPSEADLAKRMLDALAYRDRLELVAAAPDAHLGDTAAEVAQTLATIVRSIAAGVPVEVPAVARENA